MKNYILSDEQKKSAKLGGVAYIIIIITGLFAEMFVRSQLISQNNAILTAKNILSNELLFRLGFISDTIMVICDIIVGVSIYILLKKINKNMALLSVFFRLTQSIILAVNLLNQFFALSFFKHEIYMEKLNLESSQVLGMVFLKAYNFGYYLGLIFFGIYLIIIGIQFLKANIIIPKLLSLMIIISGILYFTDSIINFILPKYSSITGNLFVLPWIVTELSFAVYLVKLGIKKQPAEK